MTLAALHIGVPVVVLPAHYTKLTSERQRLLNVVNVLDPCLIYVSCGLVYETVLRFIPFKGVRVLSRNIDVADAPQIIRLTGYG